MKMKRFGCLGALASFWLVLEPGWLYVIGHVSDVELFHIDSPQREFFFRVVPWIVLAASAVTPFGYWVGIRVGQRSQAVRKLAWLPPLARIVAVAWLLFTAYILGAGLLVASMPGWRSSPPDQTPASDHPSAAGSGR